MATVFSDIRAWIAAVVRYWFTVFGGAVISVGISLEEHIRGSSVSWTIILGIMSVSFLIALFLAWRDEHHKLQSELRDRPKLSGRIEQMHLREQVPGPGLGCAILVHIKNQGTPSIARFNRVVATSKDGRPVTCKLAPSQIPIMLSPNTTPFNVWDAEVVVIPRGDGIWVSTTVLLDAESEIITDSIKAVFEDVESTEFVCEGIG